MQLVVKTFASSLDYPHLTYSGSVLYDVGSSHSIDTFKIGSNFEVLSAGTVPAGTTGSDNKVSISAVNDGKIYIENRAGAERRFKFAYL